MTRVQPSNRTQRLLLEYILPEGRPSVALKFGVFEQWSFIYQWSEFVTTQINQEFRRTASSDPVRKTTCTLVFLIYISLWAVPNVFKAEETG